MSSSSIGLIILSAFCAGGLFAYVREALRLRRLLSSGSIARATVVKKEKVDSGSESVVHYLVTYEFTDERGKTLTHEQDLNSLKFFDSIAVGDEIEILYQRDGGGISYPAGQIRADLRITRWIGAGIVIFWTVMGAIIM